MTDAKLKLIVKKIDKHMKEVARTRDHLDESIGTLEELREDCRNAYDCLEQARDALSEMV